ncbi:MAG: heme-binding protein [Betaproteobacteria bacterium]|nr:heme-binding protein [Betaproteobacteria bacterium]
MTRLTLALASIIVDKALELARARNLKPVAVAVLDAGGHLLAMKREENASILRPQIAEAKAWGCLGMGYGGREFVRRNVIRPTFYAALAVASEGRIMPVAGGVLIRAADGLVIGAVGVTGDAEDNDDACAVAGIQAAGLVPDTGDPA